MDLYYSPESPACRSVILTGAILGIDFNLIRFNMRKGEHMTPEFLQINPQHTLPTMVDGDLVLYESKAIMGYLVDQYGNDDSLYPKDPAERAIVNQRLYFDIALGASLPRFYFPLIFMKTPEDPLMKPMTDKNFKVFDQFLEDKDYAALDHLTIADIALVTTVSTYEAVGFNIENYPNVQRWYQNLIDTMPGIETHLTGVEALKAALPQDEEEQDA